VTGHSLELEPTLVALFETELETAIDTITRGLVSLEDPEEDPEQIDSMMRAAHSIKGAARIVGIEPAARIAMGSSSR
jgi:two-component system sensor histidine kinase and response regulator WspE